MSCVTKRPLSDVVLRKPADHFHLFVPFAIYESTAKRSSSGDKIDPAT